MRLPDDVTVEQVVVLDADSEGPRKVTNRAASMAAGDWLLPIGDDDLLDDEFLEVLWPHTRDADVVYGWCRVTAGMWCPNRLFNARSLRIRNFIPATALVRASLWRDLGGYREVPLEDWDFWLRALDSGARFVCVPEVVWTFRIHAGNTYTKVAGVNKDA